MAKMNVSNEKENEEKRILFKLTERNLKHMRLIRDVVTAKCDAHFSLRSLTLQPFNV